jgi:hypothetical protein
MENLHRIYTFNQKFEDCDTMTHFIRICRSNFENKK